jgi:hypothetical protein
MQRAGPLIKEWNKLIENDQSSKVTLIQKTGAGTKRKAVSFPLRSFVFYIMYSKFVLSI